MTTSDYLTCGQCLKEFPLQRITLFIEHKKLDCEDGEDEVQVTDPELQCSYCPQGFMTAWALLVHAQLTHNLKIFLEKASKHLIAQSNVSPLANSKLQRIASPFDDTNVSNRESTVATTTPVSLDTGLQQNAQSFVQVVSEPFRESLQENLSQSTLKQSQKCFVLRGNKDATERNELKIPELVDDKKPTEVRVTNEAETVKGASCGISFTDEKTPLDSNLKRFVSVEESGVCLKNTENAPFEVSLDNGVGSVKSHRNTADKLQTDNESSKCYPDVSDVSHPSPQSALVLPTSGVCSTVSSTRHMEGKPPTVGEPGRTAQLISSNPSETNTSPGKQTVVKSLSDLLSGDTTPPAVPGVIDNAAPGDSDMECCDDQGCGVTIIPGSHQDLQKCCNAVVPKKRKRHMETKHMPFSWSSSRYAQRRRLQLRNQALAAEYKSTSGTIYIDVQSDSLMSDTSCTDSETFTDPNNSSAEATPRGSTVKSEAPKETVLKGAEKKPQSLILKPGAIFSIPFEYTLPSSITLSQSSSVPAVPVSAVSPKSHDKKTYTQTTSSRTGTKTSQAAGMMDMCEGFQVTIGSEMGDGKKKRSGSSKRFQCDKCTLTFNQRIHLTKHMSKHTGIKPYKCDECDYSTVERSHLKVHIRIHTGEKPFKCTYCEYATAQNSTLKIHLKRHHGEKMFQCPNCDKKFTEEQQLKGHECEHGKGEDSSPEMQAINTLVSLGSAQGISLPPQTTPPLLVTNHSTASQPSTGSVQGTSQSSQKPLPFLVSSQPSGDQSTLRPVPGPSLSNQTSPSSSVPGQLSESQLRLESMQGISMANKKPLPSLVTSQPSGNHSSLRPMPGPSSSNKTTLSSPVQSQSSESQLSPQSGQGTSMSNQKPHPGTTPTKKTDIKIEFTD